ncbi:hypothetical protein PI125_g17403 [Phytophthora idaei]|nr:hypothetical protein PI125_g17403 [Phytophthora idaei]
MLRFATLDNEAGMSSDAIIDLLDDVLDMYGIEAAQLGFDACDHTSGNVAITWKTQVPMIGNPTHWSSTSAMVDRYFRFYGKLDRLNDGLVDFIPTPRVNVRLKALHEDFKNLESVNKKLQTSPVSLLDVRALFDHVVKHYLSTNTQLSVTTGLVKFPDFENGVVKVLTGKVRALTRTDKAAVAKLLGSTDPSEA